MNTKVNLAGVELKNPVMVASGTFGSGAEYSEFVDLNRLGAVVTKGVASVPWPGNPAPRIAETASGMLNAIGLQNPGIDLFSKRDLPFLETLADTAVKKAFITKVGQVAKRITTIEKPIIAMVNGVTAGAGVNLMLACDLIYAVDTAKFAQSFAKVGLIPDCGGLYFLPKAVGVHKAKELMFTADLIDAATAEKMALVNHIFPAAELEDAVMQMAERLAASAPLAIGLIKKYLNNTAMTLDEVLEMEAIAQPLCMGTDDSAEGITAFKEKRTPKFTGK